MDGIPNYYHDQLDADSVSQKLGAEPLSQDYYEAAHQKLVIACHDVFIEQDGKYLLVHRDNPPAADHYWPIGGRLQRGMSVEDSLCTVTRRECGLALEALRFLGTARTFFGTEPFGHGRGTDTINFVYEAKGVGRLTLDHLHSKPLWLTKSELVAQTPGESYVQDFAKKLRD